MNPKNLRAILLMIICTVFTSLGQLFWKFSANAFGLSLQGTLLNGYLILGFLCYGIGAILLIYALKSADLSLVYPFISLSFVWVALLSFFILKETISLLHGFGIFSIVLGIAFISRGAK